MRLSVVVLDDIWGSVVDSLYGALRPFVRSHDVVDQALRDQGTVRLENLMDSPVELHLRHNSSRDPETVLDELVELTSTPSADLVLLDDNWGDGGKFAGQEVLLRPLFDLTAGDVGAQSGGGLPILVLFTRHWADEVERVDRFTELLRTSPYRESNRLRGLHKDDVGGLRMVFQGLAAHRKLTDEKAALANEAGKLKATLRVLGVEEPDELPEASPVGTLVGRSLAMRAVYATVEKFASRKETRFLIFGETGTGKTAVARAVHDECFKNNRFARFDSRGMEDLQPSELFGHKRGAFTGATVDKVGLVAKADGGTLFLDNVDLLRPAVQELLLPFLESGEYNRVGDEKVQTANVRVIAASNQELRELVQEGKFRQDLYYRLNADTRIVIPPLRERPEDIEDIVPRYCEKKGYSFSFSPTALRLMRTLNWAGNVRELEGFVDEISVYAGNREIVEHHLVQQVLTLRQADLHGQTGSQPAAGAAHSFGELEPVKRKLQIVEDGLREGASKMEIGHRLSPEAGAPGPNCNAFLGTHAVGNVFTQLGKEESRRYFPNVVRHLQTKLRSALKTETYPEWIRNP